MEVSHQGTSALGGLLAGHDADDQPVVRVEGFVVPVIPLAVVSRFSWVTIGLLLGDESPFSSSRASRFRRGLTETNSSWIPTA